MKKFIKFVIGGVITPLMLFTFILTASADDWIYGEIENGVFVHTINEDFEHMKNLPIDEQRNAAAQMWSTRMGDMTEEMAAAGYYKDSIGIIRDPEWVENYAEYIEETGSIDSSVDGNEITDFTRMQTEDGQQATGSALVTFIANVSDEIKEYEYDCFVDVTNTTYKYIDDDGNSQNITIRIQISHYNDYEGQEFLPEGHYVVEQSGVINDYEYNYKSSMDGYTFDVEQEIPLNIQMSVGLDYDTDAYLTDEDKEYIESREVENSEPVTEKEEEEIPQEKKINIKDIITPIIIVTVFAVIGIILYNIIRKKKKEEDYFS